MSLNLRPYLIILATALFAGTQGCARIPEADSNFVSRNIPVGMNASAARLELENRDFRKTEIREDIKYQYDDATGRYEKQATGLRGLAQTNIGFVPLEGEPSGNLSCFSKDYSAFLSRGWRVICWTVDENSIITWRQAGWVGVSL